MENLLNILHDRVGSVVVAVEEDSLIIWNGSSTFTVIDVVDDRAKEADCFTCYCYKKEQAIEAAQEWLEENRC